MIRQLLDRFVPHDDIVIYGEVYMRRYFFARNRAFSLRIHHIRKTDEGRHLHDHPFSFLSVVLRGLYWEQFVDGSWKLHRPGTIAFRQAECAHIIPLVTNDGVWTFVATGPMRRTWGFYVDGEWIHHTDYVLEGDVR